MFCSCTTIKPSIASVSMEGFVTDQAGLSPYLAVSKVVFSSNITVWESLLRLQVSVSAVAVELARVHTFFLFHSSCFPIKKKKSYFTLPLKGHY